MPLLANIWQDARFALRSFRRNPSFTITALAERAMSFIPAHESNVSRPDQGLTADAV